MGFGDNRLDKIIDTVEQKEAHKKNVLQKLPEEVVFPRRINRIVDPREERQNK